MFGRGCVLLHGRTGMPDYRYNCFFSRFAGYQEVQRLKRDELDKQKNFRKDRDELKSVAKEIEKQRR